MNINDSILPMSANARPGNKRNIKWIVIHETGNTDKGANALAHSKYLQNVAKDGKTYVSWHYTVDDREIYRHIPDDEIAWHAGDGRTADGGNMCGIGIEICVNSDGDFNKAMQNAATLCASLCKKYNLQVGGIVRQHWEFSGKDCPKNIRAKGLWDGFLKNVATELSVINNPPQPQIEYKALYEQGLKELQETKNALVTERSKNEILGQRVTKLQDAVISIDTILQKVK